MSGFWGKFKDAWRKFGVENGGMKAASLSFYGFITVLPLLLLAVAVLGYVVSSETALRTVAGFFDRLTPSASPFINDVLRALVRTRGGITAVGVVTLVWSSSQIFVAMQMAFNDVWEVGNPPGFIRRETKAIVLLIVMGSLFVIAVGASSVVLYLRSLNLLGAGSVLSTIGSILVAVGFNILLFALLYKYVPEKNVRWRSAVFGGVVGGIVWEIIKQGYRVYLQYFANYNALYGSLGSVIILVLWIYYSAMILIYCAELAYVDQFGLTEQHEEEERLRKAS